MGKDTIDDNKLIIEDNIVSQKATRSNKPVGEAVSTDEQIEQLYKDLLAEIAKYRPNKNLDMVEKAYNLARKAHGNQKRKSGEPYIIHPLSVAKILAELELDMESIVAGILHDVVEDTQYSLEQISEMFNPDVALLVDGVTKLEKIEYSSKEEMQAENYRKMFLSMAKDIRVILIKIADRLHNMRTLSFMTPEKQKEKAQETLDIYAPLADRLGISKIKTELEDLCLRYLDKDAYFDLADKIHRKQSEREADVEKIVKEIRQKCEEADIKCTVYGRPKHFFSIYKKMVNQHKTLDQIYDVFAVVYNFSFVCCIIIFRHICNSVFVCVFKRLHVFCDCSPGFQFFFSIHDCIIFQILYGIAVFIFGDDGYQTIGFVQNRSQHTACVQVGDNMI